MFLTFFGGTKIISGVNALLEIGKRKILIDCGLFHGEKEIEEKNVQPFPYRPREIEVVILSHAHLDHCGRLPQLVKEGFCGKIFATPATLDLLKPILKDSLELQERPLFSKKEIKKVFKLTKFLEYHRHLKLFEGLRVNFLDAGHILGSAIIEIFIKDKKKITETKIVFSGDLGNFPTPLLRQAEFPQGGDFIVVESTYGDRIYKEFLQRRDILEDTIEETIKNKGVLLIPAFAIERTQEILYELNELIENRRIPKAPVFVDSPIAKRAIPIYKKYKKYYGKEASFLLRSGDDIFKFPRLKFTKTLEESKKIRNIPPPKIIIAGSGLSEGGRILFHEKEYLSHPQNCILFISYQIKGTRGRQIQDGTKEVEIFGKKIPIRAKIKTIEGYSAHPDQEALLRWIYNIKGSQLLKKNSLPKKIFVTQGEEEASKALCQLIKDKIGVEAEIPEYGKRYSLD